MTYLHKVLLYKYLNKLLSKLRWPKLLLFSPFSPPHVKRLGGYHRLPKTFCHQIEDTDFDSKKTQNLLTTRNTIKILLGGEICKK